jgi:hypothetical protein
VTGIGVPPLVKLESAEKVGNVERPDAGLRSSRSFFLQLSHSPPLELFAPHEHARWMRAGEKPAFRVGALVDVSDAIALP